MSAESRGAAGGEHAAIAPARPPAVPGYSTSAPLQLQAAAAVLQPPPPMVFSEQAAAAVAASATSAAAAADAASAAAPFTSIDAAAAHFTRGPPRELRNKLPTIADSGAARGVGRPLPTPERNDELAGWLWLRAQGREGRPVDSTEELFALGDGASRWGLPNDGRDYVPLACPWTREEIEAKCGGLLRTYPWLVCVVPPKPQHDAAREALAEESRVLVQLRRQGAPYAPSGAAGAALTAVHGAGAHGAGAHGAGAPGASASSAAAPAAVSAEAAAAGGAPSVAAAAGMPAAGNKRSRDSIDSADESAEEEEQVQAAARGAAAGRGLPGAATKLGDEGVRGGGINDHILKELKVLYDAYIVRHMDDRPLCSYKRKGLQRAMGVIGALPYRVTSRQSGLWAYEEHCDKRPTGIGFKTAQKIDEIVQKGTLERAHATLRNPRAQAIIAMDALLWVGPSSAARFFDMGFKSIAALVEGVRTRDPALMGVLTRMQRRGIELHRELNTEERIQRSETEAVQAIIAAEMQQIVPGALCVLGGSFRRQQKDSSDLDVIISPPRSSGMGVPDILPALWRRLKVGGGGVQWTLHMAAAANEMRGLSCCDHVRRHCFILRVRQRTLPPAPPTQAGGGGGDIFHFTPNRTPPHALNCTPPHAPNRTPPHTPQARGLLELDITLSWSSIRDAAGEPCDDPSYPGEGLHGILTPGAPRPPAIYHGLWRFKPLRPGSFGLSAASLAAERAHGAAANSGCLRRIDIVAFHPDEAPFALISVGSGACV